MSKVATKLNSPSRRKFLKTSAAASGGLVLGITLPSALNSAFAAEATTSMPNAWIKIGSDNTITILSSHSEMGQGVYTSMPTLVAEELEVDLHKIKVEIAPPGEVYINAMLGGQITGGSTSVREGWDKLRVAGAQARMMLTQAAADGWGVNVADCHAENGWVIGPKGKKVTYGKVAEAASKLTPPKEPKLKDPGEFKIVGKPTKRLDTPWKVNGTAEFGIDVKLPGMLYASLAQCPVIGGKVVSFDGAKAKAMPGVKHVVQITDGVAVVADSFWRAKKARDTLVITWDEGAGKAVNSPGVAAALAAAMAQPGGAVIKKVGNVDDAMLLTLNGKPNAVKVVEAAYEVPFLSHSPMEPMNFTADVRKDSCLLIGPTQFQQAAGGVAAGVTGLKPEQITVKTTFLGGGFGRRIDFDYIIQALEISKTIGAPVKLVWTREDDMTHDFYRPAGLHHMSAALDAKGNPTALKLRLTSPSVTARMFPPVVSKEGLDPFQAEAATTPYDIPNQLAESLIHDTGLRVGYWRSVSHAMNSFANESFMDELALAAGKDPVEYRMSLLSKEPRYRNVLTLATQKAGWGKPLAPGHFQGVGVMEGYGTYMAQVAEISVVNNQIKVHRVVIAADLGRMVNPNIVRQQLESSVIFGLSAVLWGEITLKDGRVQQTNFDTYRVVRMPESPKIDMIIVDSTEKPGGIGEPGTALVGATMANAVFAATGKRLRKLPLTLA